MAAGEISPKLQGVGGHANVVWNSTNTIGNPNFSAGTTSSNLGSVVFSNSNGVSFGLNGSTITASINSVGNPLFSAGTTSNNLSSIVFSNSNNVSFGLNGSTITASVNPGGGSPNFSAGTTSNNLGSVVFSNSNGVSFGLNGSTVTGSIAAQTNQTLGIYASSNTTNSSSGTVDARSISFVGYGIVSVGISGNSVLISSPATTTFVPLSVGMSTNGNTTGTTGFGSNQFVLVGGSNITLSGSTNAGSMTVSVIGGAGGAGGAALSAGTNSTNSGTVVFSNSNGVSFGMNTTGVVTAAVSNQTLGMYALGNTTQNSSSTFDGRTISYNGLGAMTVGFSNGSVQLSAPAISSITATGIVSISVNGSTISIGAVQSNQTVGFFASSNTTQSSNGTFDARSLSMVGAGNVSVGYTNGSIVISGSAAGGSSPNFSAGTTSSNLGSVVFSNSNGVSFGLNGSTITASVVPGAGTVNFSAGTTSNNLVGITFSNSNNVSFGLNGSTMTASVAVQTNQTVGMYGLGNTTQNSSSTFDARSISYNGIGALSIGFSNGSVQLSAPATSSISATGIVSISVNGSTISIGAVQSTQPVAISGSNGSFAFSTVTMGNLNGLSFYTSNGSLVGSYSVPSVAVSGSNGSFTYSTLTMGNLNGISHYTSNGSLVASYTVPTQTNQTVGMYGLGNTTQNSSTTFDARTISYNGIGAMTVGFSNGSVQLSAPAISSISGTGLVSVSVNGSTINVGVPGTTQSVWKPAYWGDQLATQIGNGTIQVFPAFANANFSASRADIGGSFSMSTSSNSSFAGTMSIALGIYTRNGSTLSLASSGSQSYAFTNTSNNSSNALSGARSLSLPINVNGAPADYWIGILSQSASAGTNWFTASNMVYSNQAMTYQGLFGVTSASTNQPILGLGQYSATSTALPGSMAFSNIIGTVGTLVPMIAFHNVTA